MTTLRSRDAIQEEAELEEEILDLVSADDELDREGFLKPGMIKENNDPTRLVTIYDTLTGEPRLVPAWTVTGKNSILRRKRDDGSREFATRKPAKTSYRRGSVMCLLHPDSERRRELDEEVGLGGRFCMSAHLGSIYARRLHMQNRHRAEWAAIQEYDNENRQGVYAQQQATMAAAAAASIEASHLAAESAARVEAHMTPPPTGKGKSSPPEAE